MNKKFIALFLVWFNFSTVYPFQFTFTNSLGFDSNYLRLSSNEMSRPVELIQQYGGLNGVSSLISRTKLGLRYFLDKKDKSFFVDFSSRYSLYSSNSDKNFFSYSFSFSKKFKSYTFLKGGYRYMPEYYLRNFIDRDFHYYYDNIYPYKGCYFSQETIWISYSLKVMKRTWFELKASQKSMFYNDRFHEYDLLINTFQSSIKTKLVKKYFFEVSFSSSSANNTTYKDGSMSTMFVDRGYNEISLRPSVSYKLNKSSFINVLGSSLSFYQRKYISNSHLDLLHIDRTHLDSKFKMWLKSDLNGLTYKVSLIFRQRVTDSPFLWVESLKSFSKYELNVEVSYRLF